MTSFAALFASFIIPATVSWLSVARNSVNDGKFIRKENNMTGRIIITGISEAEKAAKEILEHIQAIKDIQRRMVWFGSDIQIVLDSKEEAASGN